jgi:hypothetical protein
MIDDLESKIEDSAPRSSIFNPRSFILQERNMQTLWQDLRYAARSFARKPSYMLVIILTLALGIGAVSAVFSFFNAVLLRPLPYKQSERLAQLRATESEDEKETFR